MNKIFENAATTKRTIKNINKSLDQQLKKDKVNLLKRKKIKQEIMHIHGLAKENFDTVNFVGALINSKLNDISVDDNANKNDKTIAGITSESTKSFDKAVGYDYLYRQMKKDYGKQEAKRLSGLMYDLSLALADSSHILKPYCYSLDTTKLVMEGRPFGQLHSSKPKTLHSYIGQLNETVHQMSSHLAGAVALGTFFLDMAHILIFSEKIELPELATSSKKRYYVKNSMQSFIHSMNHLSRNSIETPFSNVSIFDRSKLESIIAEDNMWWFFDCYDDHKPSKEYVLDYISLLQDLYLEVFDLGDQIKKGMPLRFPVTTINFTKEHDKLKDENFLNKICNNYDISRYNIFVSEGTKVCSCCRLVNDTELMELGSESNSFGGTQVSLGSHRVVTINFNRIALLAKDEDDFTSRYLNLIDDAAKILKSHKNLLERTNKAGLQPFIANHWIRMDRLFSTIGILGIVEAAETMEQKLKKKVDFKKNWLELLNVQIKYCAKKYGIIMNIEQIPGESMAPRLAKVDKLIFGFKKVPYELYANQFVPLWQDATIYERMEADGKYNSYITGGGICHFSLGEKTTPNQNKRLIKHAVKSKCEHFALNSMYCECANGHNQMGDHKSCPICAEPIIERRTRVVGFFVPVSAMNQVRRTWEIPRRNFTKIQGEPNE